MSAKDGDTVIIEYKGTLDDGAVFDQSKEPLEFTIGAKQVIKGFNDAVIGMNVNDEKDIHLQADEAYGQPNPELVKDVPKESLPQGDEVKPGVILGLKLPNGQYTPATVVDIGEKTAKIDLNHPLAGKALNFNIKLVEIKASDA